MVIIREFEEPEVNKSEILRYAFCGARGENRTSDRQINALIDDVLTEALPVISYKVCYDILTDWHGFGKVVVFAATLGIGLDRLILKYGKLSPSRGLILQATGTERIEALCDSFEAYIRKEVLSHEEKLTPRFSPGYPKLPLECQKDIFRLLKPETNIGLTLNQSLIMSPSKSVTAVIGINTDESVLRCDNKCMHCIKKDCIFRRENI